jgi:hypothetical protein
MTGQVDAGDADPGDGRDETLTERLDRNWNELLQELRVTQTGTQILTGFLLTIAFQQKFDDLTGGQQTLYLILVCTAVATTALGLVPVSLHRGLFRQHQMERIVGAGHLIVRFVLTGIGLVLTGTVLLIFDVVAGRTAALIAASVAALLIIAIAALPTLVRALPAPGPNVRSGRKR